MTLPQITSCVHLDPHLISPPKFPLLISKQTLSSPHLVTASRLGEAVAVKTT